MDPKSTCAVSTGNLAKLNAALLKIAKHETFTAGSFSDTLRLITEAAAETLDVDRVGIWLFEERRLQIRLVDLYEHRLKRHTEGTVLKAAQYPLYFKALEERRAIVAEDARSNPATREFTESYLEPLGITSMLDASVRLSGNTVGVICHEHIGPARVWSAEEQDFAGSVADLVALAMERAELKKTEDSLRETQLKYQALLAEKLRAADERYRALVEMAPNGILMVDKTGRIVFANARAEDFVGLGRQEITKHKLDDPVWNMTDAQNRPFAPGQSPLEETVRAKKPLQNLEVNISKATGDRVTLSINTSPVLGPSGDVEEVIVFAQDVTERKKAEDNFRLYREIFLSSPNAISIVDPKGKFIERNRAHEILTQYSDADLAGISPAIYTRDPTFQGFLTELTGKGRLEREFELSRKDGKRIKIDISAFALRRENGEPLCFVGTLRDVTEASKAREALRESEERFRRFADNVDDVFWISDPDKKRMLYVNAAFERVFRLKPEEIYAESRAFLRNCHPEDRPRVEEMVARQKFGPAEVEYRIVRPDRSLQWIQSRTFPVRNESGSVYCIVGISRDITFQKQAADDLKESEVRFRQFAENIQEVFWMSDPAKNRMIYVSPAYEKIWGKSRESLYSHPMSFLDGIHPEDRARVERALEKQVRGEYDEEYRITQPDGTLRWIRDRAFPIRDEGGTVYRVAGIAEDITEAKLSEGDLLLLANITAMSVDAISTVDMDGTVTSWNRAGEDIFGFKGEEIIGKNVRDTIIPPDLKTEAFRVFDREPFAVIRQRTERLHKSGRRFPVLLTGFPLVDERGNIYGRAAIHQDITHIVDMERKLLEQSRMAAIGSMAAGIAHEIRNPLFGISSVAQILSREFAEKPPLDELANSMLEEIERLNKLLKNLLMYARPRRLECSRVRPKELFDEFMSLNQHLIRAQGVRIVARFEPENGEITADDAQIRQVILNLCLNAVQASPLNSVIEIRSQVTPERGWAFEIRNDGDSIEPANLPQIFEPFFSTKSEGSGLGLSVCKKVVEDHGGTIGCVSNKESGTSFSFSIPPAPLDAPAQSCQKEATP